MDVNRACGRRYVHIPLTSKGISYYILSYYSVGLPFGAA
jgi:hypothetical protein